MREQLTHVMKHSAVYAVGNVLNRGAAFVLLPLYTHYLLPAEYGILTILLVTAFVVRSLLSMGIAHATLRFYFEFEREEDRRRVISTCLLAALAFGAAGIGVLLPWVGALSQALFKSDAHIRLFHLVLATLLLEMTIEVARAFIRAKERSLLFVAVSLLQLLAKVGFNLYTVVVLRLGVEGILWGNLWSVALIWVVLVPMTVRYAGLAWDLEKLKAVLRYSLPLVPGLILGMVAVSSDRFFLARYATLAEVGLYGLAMNFGVLMLMACVEPFTLAFGPYRFSIMREPNAKAVYARVLTYLVMGLSFAWLVLSVFAREIVQLIAPPAFLEAWTLVPVICGGVAVGGALYLFQTGIYLTKRTQDILLVSAISCAATLLLHRLLIPLWGMVGAAAAVCLANAVGCLGTYLLAQRAYPITYERARALLPVAVAGILYGLSLLIPAQPAVATILLKGLVVAGFAAALWALGLVTKGERQQIGRLLRRRSLQTQVVPQ